MAEQIAGMRIRTGVGEDSERDVALAIGQPFAPQPRWGIRRKK